MKPAAKLGESSKASGDSASSKELSGPSGASGSVDKATGRLKHYVPRQLGHWCGGPDWV